MSSHTWVRWRYLRNLFLWNAGDENEKKKYGNLWSSVLFTYTSRRSITEMHKQRFFLGGGGGGKTVNFVVRDCMIVEQRFNGHIADTKRQRRCAPIQYHQQRQQQQTTTPVANVCVWPACTCSTLCRAYNSPGGCVKCVPCRCADGPVAWFFMRLDRLWIIYTTNVCGN